MDSLWLDRAPRFSSDPVPGGPVDDVVAGAGITGLVTALLLARAGRRVALVEARHVGAVTTGNTSAKVSLLQGTKLSRLLGRHDRRTVRAHLDANLEGQQWLLRFCSDHRVPVQAREAVTYAATDAERDVVRREHEAASGLGLDVQWRDRLDVPFPHVGATVLADQAQLDPMAVLGALVEQLRAHGGTLHQGLRLTGVSWTGRPVATLRRTDDDEEEVRLTASDVVLATGAPVLDRGLHFAKQEALRSYVLALESPEQLTGMYLSAGRDTRSLRDVPPAPGGTGHLLVGGSGHPVGRTRSERQHVEELLQWAERHYPGARLTHQWSAQDYRPADGLPIVEPLPRGGGRIHVATGFDKWGMTNGVAAARAIAGRILGEAPGWSRTTRSRSILSPGSLASIASINVRGLTANAESLVRAEAKRAPQHPHTGRGVVGRAPLLPRGVSDVEGRPCAVSAVCTHAGGILKWNDAEHTWDCPWHGSRFAADGAVLEGPATRPLARPE